MIQRRLGGISTPPATHSHWPHQLRATVAAFVSLLIITWVNQWLTPHFQSHFLVASIGASTILVFVLHASPVSQPYSLLLGNTLAAIIGVSCAYLPFDLAWSAAICIALCFAMMFIAHCVHPPAGATALMPVILGPEAIHGYYFVVFPVLINVAVLLVLAVIWHRFWLSTSYPNPPADDTHEHAIVSSSITPKKTVESIMINIDDIEKVISQMEGFVDITKQDLLYIYSEAYQHAQKRLNTQQCKATE